MCVLNYIHLFSESELCFVSKNQIRVPSRGPPPRSPAKHPPGPLFRVHGPAGSLGSNFSNQNITRPFQLIQITQGRIGVRNSSKKDVDFHSKRMKLLKLLYTSMQYFVFNSTYSNIMF